MLTNGFNLIAHSQGGLLARAYVERCVCPNVASTDALGTYTPTVGVCTTGSTTHLSTISSRGQAHMLVSWHAPVVWHSTN